MSFTSAGSCLANRRVRSSRLHGSRAANRHGRSRDCALEATDHRPADGRDCAAKERRAKTGEYWFVLSSPILPSLLVVRYYDHSVKNFNIVSTTILANDINTHYFYCVIYVIGLYRENAIATESEAIDPFGGNVYYVTMQITFHIPEFARKERNLHCEVVHITTKWVSRHVLDHAIAAIQASR